MTIPISHQELGHGITLIDAEYLQPGVAAIYLLQQGEQVAIIETGTAFSVPRILALLQQRGIDRSQVAYVIPTHVHLDHAGGAGELMARCPNARLVIHPFGARHMIDPSRLQQGVIAVYGEEAFRAYYGELKPIAAERVIEAADNFTLELNGRPLRFIDTPGHARHHFCIFDEVSRGLFTGDAFGLSYPRLMTGQGPFIFATTTPVQFDPEAMLASIDRLLQLQPQTLYLTHCGAIDATPAIVAQLKETIAAFVQIALEEKGKEPGRQQRIEQRLLEYLLRQLQQRGCPLPPQECRQLLANDAQLNAQGLEVWLNR